MTWLNGALATCRFELKRSMTLQRLAVSSVLALFPPGMAFVSLAIPGNGVAEFIEFFIILQVALVTSLSLLLWATPIVFTEIEGKSWVFLASRPGGRISIYIGKYLAAVIFTSMIAFFAITLSMMVATAFGTLAAPIYKWACLCLIFIIAAFGYGAVFSLIGTLLFKRSMVLAAGYMIAWEGIIANFPAIINRMTLRYHLQSLGIEWLGYFLPEGMFPFEYYVSLYGEPNWLFHFPLLGIVTVLLVSAGCLVIVNRQYITSDETQ